MRKLQNDIPTIPAALQELLAVKYASAGLVAAPALAKHARLVIEKNEQRCKFVDRDAGKIRNFASIEDAGSMAAGKKAFSSRRPSPRKYNI